MREGERLAFVLGFFVGCFVMLLTMEFVINQENGAWKQQAIDHGAARYNATSGEFEWTADAVSE